jgi:hypothetical protein
MLKMNRAAGAAALAAAILGAGCLGGSGGGSAASLTGVVYKGPTAGAQVCAYRIDDAAADRKGALVEAQPGSGPTLREGCVVTGADGAYAIVLPAEAAGGARLLVESTGGTYCSDESLLAAGSTCAGGGTPIAMGATPLRAFVAAPPANSVSVPLTLLTTAATQAAATLDAAGYAAAYGTIANSFGVSADPSTSPRDGVLSGVLTTLSGMVGTDGGNIGAIVGAIASGTLTGGSTGTQFPAGTEFVAGADQELLRLFTASASQLRQVSTAELPGIPGTYTRTGTTVTVAMQGHRLSVGTRVHLNFAAGTGGAATSGTYAVDSVVDADTFTVVDAASGAITGGRLFRKPVTRLAASYVQQSGSATVTVTSTAHGLQSGWDVTFDLAGTEYTLQTTVVDADSFTVTLPAAATANASGPLEVKLGANWTTVDIALHPSGRWLYAASLYDCASGSPFCWGGDVISQYAINWSTGRLSFVAAVRTGDGTDSSAAPVRLAFNPAGTRLAHQDDSLDGIRLWSVDTSTGALTQVAASASGSTGQHGIRFSNDGTLIYHGSSVFTVGTGPDSVTKTRNGLNVNAIDIVGTQLFGTRANTGLYAWSLADPLAPAQVATASAAWVRETSTRNGSVVLASGFGGVKAYTFDGSSFAAATGGEMQRDGTTSLGDSTFMYRSVDMNAAGTLAIASYFTSPDRSRSNKGGAPSGYMLVTVGQTGAVARVADMPTAAYARAAKFIRQP